ncbi:hypothetical protein [Streptomyces alkaliterrae]|uniref:Uncharacterized protein n=1 Tax=Streptomyces alkaliterrae TaxID=2213162 RepID=A0A5P0YQQ0_9ACTN|nr:hypothetical protein [Streptomyces alkaliterrae]MBB1258394.1 hypothetical protein [Streptomyces alkaliterrae]MQS02240.1 hypothetical protein [Streptomyces alkaliterrae]
MGAAPIIVYPPATSGGRRVRADGEILGVAYSAADLEEFLRRAGIEDPDLREEGLIEWRGGGPEVWG